MASVYAPTFRRSFVCDSCGKTTMLVARQVRDSVAVLPEPYCTAHAQPKAMRPVGSGWERISATESAPGPPATHGHGKKD